MKKIVSLTMALLGAVVVVCAALPDKTNRFVNDFAGVFDSRKAMELEEYLATFSDTTTNQVVVVTIADLEDYEPADYAQRLGQKWGVGSAQNDNGVIILVKPRNEFGGGAVEISTGYGAEGVLTDARCGQIIDKEMMPYLQQGDYFEACNAGARACCRLLLGEYHDNWDNDQADDDDLLWMLLCVVLVVACVGFFVLKPSKKTVALRAVANADTVAKRDAAVARAKELKISDEKITAALKDVPKNMERRLYNASTPDDFEKLAAAALALGLSQAAIDMVRWRMPEHTLEQVKNCNDRAKLSACRRRALAFGNSQESVAAAAAIALAAIVAAAARSAAHRSVSSGSFGGGHHGFGGGSFGGGGAGRKF